MCRLYLLPILLGAVLNAQEAKIPEKALAVKATFKSLQETLGAIGRVDDVFHYHNDKNGVDWTTKFGWEFSNVQASAEACRLDYDERRIVKNEPGPKRRQSILLNQPWAVRVRTGEQATREEDARSGHPEAVALQVVPPTFVVGLAGPSRHDFLFRDEAAARHAADLLKDALQLCGGGEPPEPGVGEIRPRDVELRAAMQYLEYQLGSYGPVNYLVQEEHAKQVNKVVYAPKVTRFRANPETCRIDFHEWEALDGKAAVDQDAGTALRDVRDVRVSDQSHRLKRTVLESQHVNADFKVEPEVYVIDMMTKKGLVSVGTYDWDLAVRLARVIQHATELCGGGPPAM